LGSDEPFQFWWISRNADAQPADPKATTQKLAELQRGIVEGQSRTSAFATIIAEKVRASEDTEELERRMLAELDKLLTLRLDYRPLCFLSGTHGDPTDC
jgi:hypothetical protein